MVRIASHKNHKGEISTIGLVPTGILLFRNSEWHMNVDHNGNAATCFAEAYKKKWGK
jgi:hypothetical protein